jgi:AcrR family transcriptional regulator
MATTTDLPPRLKTRERLLNSAEELFATRGLDSVSVRDITEAAGANAASIHYHFGSKADLIAAIFQRRAAWLTNRRSELLAKLEKRDHVDLRDVVDAIIRPTAELVADEDGGRYYIAFLTALGNSPDLMHVVIEAYEEDTARVSEILARVTPGLPQQTRMLRYAVIKDIINRVLGLPGAQVRLWLAQQSPGADVDIDVRLTDIIVGIFEARAYRRRRTRVSR